MSGIAEILAGAGVAVSGCDAKRSAATALLASRGIDVAIGHDAAHIQGQDLIVVTSAVKGEHPELDAARIRGIRVMKRSEALGAIVNRKRAVAVAGTHGKTTTSAMISVVLEEAGLDPTVLVGGIVRNLKTNAKRGAGEMLVVEADEYDRSFHALHPEIAVVTNIEADHLEYYKSFDAIVEAFRVFLAGVKGTVIACIDDDHVAQVIDEKTLTYGLSESAKVRATNLEFSEGGATFEVPKVGKFTLRVPGVHNVRNALAAIGVGITLGIEPARIASGLEKFLGVDRRFQILGQYIGAIVVDDYAHHPTEIRATLEAARRGYPHRRIVALFQPHLYSRTRDFAREFGEALRIADMPLLAPIYAAREAPMEGVSARIISDSVPGIEFLDRSHSQIVNEMRRRLRPNDIFIT
ncbi:MAG TPA: UDP-N-acetylmuramate--L-alanine ligase, partial [Thermoanaerobaculia bacterium]|nr:UDP-N-acetylmuramate--L-alanine ligase [Thermoanaerobaculia bacterium]